MMTNKDVGEIMAENYDLVPAARLAEARAEVDSLREENIKLRLAIVELTTVVNEFHKETKKKEKILDQKAREIKARDEAVQKEMKELWNKPRWGD